MIQQTAVKKTDQMSTHQPVQYNNMTEHMQFSSGLDILNVLLQCSLLQFWPGFSTATAGHP